MLLELETFLVGVAHNYGILIIVVAGMLLEFFMGFMVGAKWLNRPYR